MTKIKTFNTETQRTQRKRREEEREEGAEKFTDADFEALNQDLGEMQGGAALDGVDGGCEGEKVRRREGEDGGDDGSDADIEEETKLEVQERSLAVPVVEMPFSYACRRFTVVLSREQATGLRKVTEGLKREGIVLMSGKKIKDHQDAVKWIFECLN